MNGVPTRLDAPPPHTCTRRVRECAVVCTGQSDSTNGRNNVYDEMIDDLCEADGSDRLECSSPPEAPPPQPFIHLSVLSPRCCASCHRLEADRERRLASLEPSAKARPKPLRLLLGVCRPTAGPQARVHLLPHGDGQEQRRLGLARDHESADAARRDALDVRQPLPLLQCSPLHPCMSLTNRACLELLDAPIMGSPLRSAATRRTPSLRCSTARSRTWCAPSTGARRTRTPSSARTWPSRSSSASSRSSAPRCASSARRGS